MLIRISFDGQERRRRRVEEERAQVEHVRTARVGCGQPAALRIDTEARADVLGRDEISGNFDAGADVGHLVRTASGDEYHVAETLQRHCRPDALGCEQFKQPLVEID